MVCTRSRFQTEVEGYLQIARSNYTYTSVKPWIKFNRFGSKLNRENNCNEGGIFLSQYTEWILAEETVMNFDTEFKVFIISHSCPEKILLSP